MPDANSGTILAALKSVNLAFEERGNVTIVPTEIDSIPCRIYLVSHENFLTCLGTLPHSISEAQATQVIIELNRMSMGMPVGSYHVASDNIAGVHKDKYLGFVLKLGIPIDGNVTQAQVTHLLALTFAILQKDIKKLMRIIGVDAESTSPPSTL